jgi:hypothetical protein
MPTTTESLTAESDTTPADDTRPHCVECGTLLEYSGRGRKPKFCAEHKPQSHKAGEGSTGRTRRTGTGKADREAQEIATAYLGTLKRAAAYVSLVDPYDAFVIMAASESNAQLFQGVVANNDKLRQYLSAAQGSGGLVAYLMSTLVTILFPIAAHHKLIPAEITRPDGQSIPVGKALENLPQVLYKMQRKANVATADLMDEMAAASAAAAADVA